MGTVVWAWATLSSHVDTLATTVASQQVAVTAQAAQINANQSSITAVTIRLTDDEAQALAIGNRISDLTARIDAQASTVAAEGATLSGVADNVNRILTILQGQRH
jgi:predicted  nucleic acid-binding Zn-ribbon protein